MKGKIPLGAAIAMMVPRGHGVPARSSHVAGRRRRTVVSLEPLESRCLLDARVLITEFVAENRLGREDEDGAQSDWIEIHNAGDTAADLGGWYLTDDPAELTKWRIPSLTLYSKQYLLVHASGNDRRDASRALHTNFRLAADGEFLALVEPDGVTLASAFAPAFPRQYPDMAYGVAQEALESRLVGLGTQVGYLVPSIANGGDTLGLRWTEPEFDDQAWSLGDAGVGYARTSGILREFIQTDIEPQMFGVNRTTYLRVPFAVDDPYSVASMTLDMHYTGGYVAYLNGVEIARRAAPEGVPSWDAGANASRIAAARFPERVDLNANRHLLVGGENLLAIQALNHSLTGSDFLMLPLLSMVQPDGPPQTDVRYLAVPTPGAPNDGVSYRGVIDELPFSHRRGFYDTPFELTFASGVPGATVVYTVDGSLPTLENGTQIVPGSAEEIVSVTLPVTRSTTLRATAFKADYLTRQATTHSYLFLEQVARQDLDTALQAGMPPLWPRPGSPVPADYEMDPDVVGPDDRFGGAYAGRIVESLKAVPTLSLVLPVDEMFGPAGIYPNASQSGSFWERATSVEWMDPSRGAEFQIDAGVRIQGGSFRNFDVTRKKSFRLEFRAEYGATKLEFPLFGPDAAARFDTIVLRANNSDGWQSAGAEGHAQYIRDEWMRQTQLAMAQPSAHGTFVHLYINGIYWGLYNAIERPEASFASTYLGGDDNQWDALNVVSAVDGNVDAWRQLVEQVRLVNVPDQQRRSNRFLQQLLGNRADKSRNPDIEPLLDLENFIDYMILNYFAGNIDWPHRNWYSARRRGPQSEGFKFFSWDAEASLNLSLSTLYVDRTGIFEGIADIHRNLLANNEYRRMFGDRVARHFSEGGVFYVDPAHPQWDPAHPEWNMPAALYSELADQVELAMIAESARWGDQHRTERPYTLADWQDERDGMLIDYFPQRSAIVLDQLIAAGLYPAVEAPRLNRHGGKITGGFPLIIRGPGVVYYTLDGSDPRQDSFGRDPPVAEVSATATLFEKSVVLGNGTTPVKARSLVDGQWSALVEAVFTTDGLPLRISEIMYHPPEPEVDESFDREEYEFIELVNTSTTGYVDLEGVALTRGIGFVFSEMRVGPGERIVVGRNMAAFVERYGSEARVAGQYGGTAEDFKLSNGGETLRLEDASGRLIQDVRFNDAWYPATDGAGTSLEIVDEASPDLNRWNQPSGWRASLAWGGTPGRGRSDVEVAIGDLNLNGMLDDGDIQGLALALASRSAYEELYGAPPHLAGDTDGDGDLDFDDIAGFLELTLRRKTADENTQGRTVSALPSRLGDFA